MIEASFLAGQLTDPSLQQGNGGQLLPSPQEKDVGRFQDIMTSEKNATTAVEPQSLGDNNNSSVLQFAEPGQEPKEASLVDKMIEQATKMDSSYHSLLDEMANRPGLDSYLNNQTTAVDEKMMTYPQVSSDGEKKADVYQSVLQRIEEVNTATLQYQSDMNQWAMGFRMWSTGIEVVAAAAKKVSQGFQTLFRASG